MGSIFRGVTNLVKNTVGAITGSTPDTPVIQQSTTTEAAAPTPAQPADTPKAVDTGEEGGDSTKASAKRKGKKSVTITRSGSGGSGINV